MPLLAVSVISAGVLAYEILLTRLFSIIQWHHLAYMVISVALLGYGASGTFLALFRDRLVAHFGTAFAGFAALFGISGLACFAIAGQLPFNALALVWEPLQLFYLGALYALFIIPFFSGACCVGLMFTRYPGRAGRIYRYDLVGAGAGALGILATLFLVFPDTALRVVVVLGPVASVIASLGETGARRMFAVAAYGAVAIALAVVVPPSWTEFEISQYKGLSTALLLPDAEVIAERSSPLGLLSVVRSPTIPFRHAPGASLGSLTEPPEQLGVFTDGGAMTAISRFSGDPDDGAHLDDTTAALPYRLLDKPAVLVLGAGGGADVLLALYNGASQIDAIELNPQIVDLVRELYAEFAGDLYDRPGVDVRVAEAREFVATSARRYDLILLPLLDSFAAAAAGTVSLSESYIYTVEALEDYLGHLRPGGYLAITRWLKLPPRDSLKLLATALAALERAGARDPARHLALIRSWDTTTLVVKNSPLTTDEIARVGAFAEGHGFDIAYVPGLERGAANRFNMLDEAYFFDGAKALAGDGRLAFIERYSFNIAPATDDRPFFFDFFRWRSLPEIIAMQARGGVVLFDWGYIIIFVTLLQAVALSAILILLPMWRRRVAGGPWRWPLVVYFFSIGLAFLFVEIASIHRFVLFLGHPLHAIAVVLCGFLVFAGLGAGVAPRLGDGLAALGNWAERAPYGAALLQRLARRGPIEVAVAAIVVFALLYLLALPPLFGALISLPDSAKILLSLALIAPLAFFMGMPFPLALAQVGARNPAFVPWAWGINGCASVLSAVLATLLAITWGFSAVVLIATGFYLLAAAVAGAPVRRQSGI